MTKALASLVCISLGWTVQATQVAEPDVETVLRVAGAYLAEYERTITAIVSEEDYLQRVPSEGVARRLRSDVLVLPQPGAGWIGFRDVFEMDGRPVRDRDQRLSRLFIKADPDALRQAKRIVDEGTRFNLNPLRGGGVSRTLNQPFTALKFLVRENQSHSTFRVDRRRTAQPGNTVVIEFIERDRRRLIATPDDAAAQGVFWIDAATGRVNASKLTVSTGGLRADFDVSFSEQPKLGLWLPTVMTESYTVERRNLTTIEGRATYSNFRRFQVDTGFVAK
jgi:hypothetical protein